MAITTSARLLHDQTATVRIGRIHLNPDADEVSWLGASICLAPKLSQDLTQPIRALRLERGTSVRLMELNVRETLKVSDRVEVVKARRMARDARPGQLREILALMELY